MRILAVTNLYPSPLHPTRATFNRQSFKALGELHDVAVVSPVAWTDEAAAWRRGVTLPAGRELDCDGLRVQYPRYLFPPKVLRGLYGRCYRSSIRSTFARALEAFRPDVILAAWAYPDGWAVVDLAKRAGVPVVVQVHGSDVLLADGYGGRHHGTAEALRRADGVVTVSRHLADRVRSWGVPPGRVRVVYLGIDPAMFAPGDRQAARRRLGLAHDRSVLLFIGNLVAVKGVDLLLDACGQLRARGHVFTCHLIGQGPLRAQFEQQAARLGLSDEWVKFAGPRPHADLPDWYHAADLFVLPSRSEGVPTVLLEASACGTPYVASRVGGIPEISHLGQGTLVPPENAAALADAIEANLAGAPARRSPASGSVRTLADAAADLSAFLEEAAGHARRAKNGTHRRPLSRTEVVA